jgi:hypothetical protein
VATAVALVMLVISVVGIRLSARTQVAIGVMEYALLIVISAAGLAWVLGRRAGSFPITRGWFTLHGIGQRLVPVRRAHRNTRWRHRKRRRRPFGRSMRSPL